MLAAIGALLAAGLVPASATGFDHTVQPTRQAAIARTAGPPVAPSLPGFPGFLLSPGERAEATPPPVPAPPGGAPAGDRTACSERSWTGGTTEWCAGALVYRDHVHDDTGADRAAGSPHGASSSPATGDVDHLAHGQARGTTDLLVLRLRAVEGGLHARFELNALFPGDRTVAALAVDLDDDVATGGGAWSGVGVVSGGWDVQGVLDTRDPQTNVIEGVVPMPLPSSGTVRIQAVVALGDGTPMNVAFRPGEAGAWFEASQSAALAAGDVSAFGHRVAVADLRAGLDRPAPLRTGLQGRVFRSPIAPGEGVAAPGILGETGTRWTHIGHHQPYALYVPDSMPQDVQLVLHGSGSSHTAMLTPGMRAAFGDGQQRILVSPFGRGESGGYVDWSLHDVLGALDDVERTYGTDPDTVILSGYSMGGGGALQLAAWFPDRFAAVIGWVPFTGDCLNGTPLAQGDARLPGLDGLASLDPTNLTSNSVEDRSGCPLATRGNTLDYLGNLRHVPTAVVFGAADELVWPNHALAAARRLVAEQVEHRLWLHVADHLLLAALDQWDNQARWSAGRRRPEQVALVQYRTSPTHQLPDLGIVPDGAYWVDDIRPRTVAATPEGDAVVELRSHACPGGGEAGLSIRPDSGLTPTPWVGQAGVPREAPEGGGEGSARISGELRNAASLTIDPAAACLGEGPIVLDIAVDGPTIVRFSDGRAAVELSPAGVVPLVVPPAG